MRPIVIVLSCLLLFMSPVLADVVASGFDHPTAMVSDGTYLYVLELKTGSVEKIQLGSEETKTFPLNLLNPADIAFDSSGNLVVPDKASSDLRIIDPATGQQVSRISIDDELDIKPFIQRVAKSPNGDMNVAILDETVEVRMVDGF